MPLRPRGPESRRTWRPELAYAVGLIVTDGNLSSDGRSICLVSKDIEQLETFAHILELTNRIARHRGGWSQTAFRIQFGDRLFHEWLVNIGVLPRKTSIIGPVDVPDEFFRDFLRGHLDGDGSITTYIDRYCTRTKPEYVYQRLYVRFLSASRQHVVWLQGKIRQLLGVDGYLTVRRPTRPRRAALYFIHLAKKDAIALLRWIYHAPDVPCLTRKRAIAEPFLIGDIRDFRHPRDLRVREGRPIYCRVADIASRQGIPAAYVSKVVQSSAEEGSCTPFGALAAGCG